ncbi:MAG: hypothetical protein ABIH37_05335 [archaeon]
MQRKKKKERKTKVKKEKTSKEKTKKKTDIEEVLINNFVNLQKVLTNLAIRFDDLSKNISTLLELFEISAKSFAEKGPGKQSQIDQDFLKKLDSLLDQNKTISKGIMLMEGKIRNKDQPQQSPERYRMLNPRPLPRY